MSLYSRKFISRFLSSFHASHHHCVLRTATPPCPRLDLVTQQYTNLGSLFRCLPEEWRPDPQQIVKHALIDSRALKLTQGRTLDIVDRIQEKGKLQNSRLEKALFAQIASKLDSIKHDLISEQQTNIAGVSNTKPAHHFKF